MQKSLQNPSGIFSYLLEHICTVEFERFQAAAERFCHTTTVKLVIIFYRVSDSVIFQRHFHLHSLSVNQGRLPRNVKFNKARLAILRLLFKDRTFNNCTLNKNCIR